MKKLVILSFILLILTGCNEQKKEEPNTKVEQNTQIEPETKPEEVEQNTQTEPETKPEEVEQNTQTKPETKPGKVEQNTQTKPETKPGKVEQNTQTKPETKPEKTEQNTQTKPETKPEEPKYSGPTTIDHLNLNENIEVTVNKYYLTPFKHGGICDNVVDTYGQVGDYGGIEPKCFSHEINQEAIDYLSNTPYIKYNGLYEVDGYQTYAIEYLFFHDGRFRTEYIMPQCYWGQLTPELNSITKKIHAYNTNHLISDAKRVMLDEKICKEFQLNCDRW